MVLLLTLQKKIDLPPKCKEISLKNLHVSNGWFDTSVSLGEPGYEEREKILFMDWK